mgnify:CR=1 FL=1
MGKIRIFYYGFLIEIAGKTHEEVVYEDKTPRRVEDVLDPRVVQYLDRIIILVNNVSVRPGHVVGDGDEIKVLPHIGGG